MPNLPPRGHTVNEESWVSALVCDNVYKVIFQYKTLPRGYIRGANNIDGDFQGEEATD